MLQGVRVKHLSDYTKYGRSIGGLGHFFNHRRSLSESSDYMN